MLEAVILAAGYGTRAGSYASGLSKGLLDVAGKPAIYYSYKQVNDSKHVSKVWIITNRSFEGEYTRFLGLHGSPKAELLVERVSTLASPLGAVATLNYVIQTTNIKKDVLLVAADNVFDFSLERMIEYYESVDGNVFGLYELPIEEARNHSVVTINKNRVDRYEEKPEVAFSTKIVTYCIILNQETLRMIAPWLASGGNPDSIGQFLASTKERIPLIPFYIGSKWFDIGSERYYSEANEYFATNYNS